jgi:hypothetical protein
MVAMADKKSVVGVNDDDVFDPDKSRQPVRVIHLAASRIKNDALSSRGIPLFIFFPDFA